MDLPLDVLQPTDVAKGERPFRHCPWNSHRAVRGKADDLAVPLPSFRGRILPGLRQKRGNGFPLRLVGHACGRERLQVSNGPADRPDARCLRHHGGEQYPGGGLLRAGLQQSVKLCVVGNGGHCASPFHKHAGNLPARECLG